MKKLARQKLHAMMELSNQLLEDAVEEEKLDDITFEELVETVNQQYKLSTNDTLTHYKFKCLTQQQGETFDMFAIRTKRLAQS